eukprot:scaffold257809_cov22-Prasinocladus_malaysianus.AAC.3
MQMNLRQGIRVRASELIVHICPVFPCQLMSSQAYHIHAELRKTVVLFCSDMSPMIDLVEIWQPVILAGCRTKVAYIFALAS